jgi:hypothetical protein
VSSGHRKRATRSAAPNPLPPSLPAPAAPGTGASAAGQGGGVGGLVLTGFAALAALIVLGIPLLLRKVYWSDLRMPRRFAALPWRPG